MQRKIRCGCEGYLTVFLSLTLTIILSLFFTLIYGARVNAVRMQAQIIMDTAANSCLGEFSRELLSQYDLFFIDTSYGTAKHSETLCRRHLEEYARKNMEGTGASLGTMKSLNSLSLVSAYLNDCRYACDRNFTPVLEQITAYMTADPAGAAAGRILSLTNDYQEIGLDLGEWEKEKGTVEDELADAAAARNERVNSINDARREDYEARLHEEEERAAAEGVDPELVPEPDTYSEPEIENPTAELDEFRVHALTDQVFGMNSTEISTRSISSGTLYSHRTPHYGSGLSAENSHQYEKASRAVQNLYLFEKCGNLRQKKEGSALDYELEYILCGKDSDRGNLESTLQRFLAIRLAANCLYLFSSNVRRSEAAGMAAGFAAVTCTPGLAAVYTTAILLGWGYMESIQDLKTLVQGGRVPLLKDDASWKTGLNAVTDPTSVSGVGAISSESAGLETNNTQGGLNYEEYLGILILLQGQNEKLSRLMDICEMDIRKTPGNENFCMDWCMDTFTASLMVDSSIGYSCRVTRTITYN